MIRVKITISATIYPFFLENSRMPFKTSGCSSYAFCTERFCIYFLVLIRIRPEQEYQQHDQEHEPDCSSKRKSSAKYESTDLVYRKAYHVSEYILEQNREPEPFPGLHLLCYRGDCRQAWRVKQVEQQEGEGCHGSREPCRYTLSHCHRVFHISCDRRQAYPWWIRSPLSP